MPGSYSLGLNFNRIYCDFTKSCSYLLGLKGQVYSQWSRSPGCLWSPWCVCNCIMRSDQSLLGYHICQPFSISSSSAPGTTHKASRTRVNLWLAIFLISKLPQMNSLFTMMILYCTLSMASLTVLRTFQRP